MLIVLLGCDRISELFPMWRIEYSWFVAVLFFHFVTLLFLYHFEPYPVPYHEKPQVDWSLCVYLTLQLELIWMSFQESCDCHSPVKIISFMCKFQQHKIHLLRLSNCRYPVLSRCLVSIVQFQWIYYNSFGDPLKLTIECHVTEVNFVIHYNDQAILWSIPQVNEVVIICGTSAKDVFIW